MFWSADERFLKQFRGGSLAARFKPYSKFPPCFKDVSFWTSPEFSENNLCEVVRSVAGARLLTMEGQGCGLGYCDPDRVKPNLTESFAYLYA